MHFENKNLREDYSKAILMNIRPVNWFLGGRFILNIRPVNWFIGGRFIINIRLVN